MNPAFIITDSQDKKRKSSMVDASDQLPLAAKRLHTVYDSPESMIIMDNDATVHQHTSNPDFQPSLSSTSSTSSSSSSISMSSYMPMNAHHAHNLDYQPSPNATTPAFASCNTAHYPHSGEYLARPSTPPFSMTLAHYDVSSGGYSSSNIDL